jgi:hypothetical protein
MKDATLESNGEPSVRGDGCLQYGATVIEPWPSLRITPIRTTALVREILWAEPGDRVWPFTARIPRMLRQRLQRAPTNAWDLLELAAAAPERGCEMVRQCPALAILIAGSCLPDCVNRSAHLCRMLDLTWRQATGAVGLPAKRRIVRILRKLPIEHCHENTVEILATACRSRHPHLHILSHLPRITRDTVAILKLPLGMTNSRLLLASANSDYDEDPVRWCLDAVAWFREREHPGRPWPYRQLDYLALTRVAQKFRARYGEDGEFLTPFPPPPIPGVPGRITALRDFWRLVAEGHQQCNCVEIYAPEIVTGRSYVYAVTVCERATLAIRRRPGRDGWQVDDLRAVNNAAPSETTQRFVEDWLKEHQSGEAS